MSPIRCGATMCHDCFEHVQNSRCASTISGDLCDAERFFAEQERTTKNHNDLDDFLHESKIVVVRQQNRDSGTGALGGVFRI